MCVCVSGGWVGMGDWGLGLLDNAAAAAAVAVVGGWDHAPGSLMALQLCDSGFKKCHFERNVCSTWSQAMGKETKE